ncbi:MAG TPA: helix-turn-helix domain-containing protein [Candidatus Thermoplasmatota archaeon]|nr:helix-turn-helix domain-containing protein [Candidatus Thermoplasmatota archaeon]
MPLTEVVFEVSDESYPLCQFTRAHGNVRAVYRVTDVGVSSGFFRATITLLGPTELTSHVLKELRALKRYDELEVLSMTPSVLLLKLGNRVDHAPGIVGIGFQPVNKVLEIFGMDTLIEPATIENGTIRCRFLVPQNLETRRVLSMLQALQSAIQWTHFRVIRVAEYKATRYADVVRRLLGPDQEDLIHLAVALGFYNSPKACTLNDISARVGLSISPVHKKLKAIEQTLINAYVDPTAVKAPPRRARRPRPSMQEGSVPVTGGMTEVAVHVEWPGFLPSEFAARNDGLRAVYQALHEDPRSGTASALYVVVAPPRQAKEFLDLLQANKRVQSVEVVSKDMAHLTVKVKAEMPQEPAGADDLVAFTRLHSRFGPEAYFKPVLFEGKQISLRFVILRRVTASEVEARLERIGAELGWRDFEVVSLRGFEGDPSMGPEVHLEKVTPRQEEVLRIAHALGYYKTPRDCTLEDIARTLGISANAIHKNLTAAEEKIIRNYLNSGF